MILFPPRRLLVREWQPTLDCQRWLDEFLAVTDGDRAAHALYRTSDEGPSHLISLSSDPDGERIPSASDRYLVSSMSLHVDFGVVMLPSPVQYPLGPVLSLSVIEVDTTELVDQFNRWYRETHLLDAMACPGFLAGARYHSDQAAKSVTLYALADESAMRTSEINAVRGFDRFEGHLHHSRSLYRPIEQP